MLHYLHMYELLMEEPILVACNCNLTLAHYPNNMTIKEGWNIGALPSG